MKRNKLTLAWGVSLIICGVCVLIQSANSILSGISGGFLSDTAVRVIGIIQLCSMPFIMIFTVKLYSFSRDNKNNNKGA